VTTYASYGLENQDPMLALVEAERLARDSGREAARRLRDDGSIDVAVMENGLFRLYSVDPRGFSTLVESAPPPAGRPYWRGLMWLGLAILPIAFAAAVIRYPGGTAIDDPPEAVAMGLAALAAVVGGLAARRYNLRWHLSKRFTDPEEWRRFREPSGWSPRSMAQIAAAERLAYYHEGKAMVRELPDGAAEVVTEKSGRLVRHRIDATGAQTELPGNGRTLRYHTGVAMAAVGTVGSLVAFMVLGHTVGGFWGLGGAFAMMMLVPLGATLSQRDDVERRVPRSEPGTWYFLRTNAEPRGD